MKILSLLTVLVISSLLLIAACSTDASSHNNKKQNVRDNQKYLHLVPNPKPTNGWVKQVESLPSYPGSLSVPIFSGMVEITRLRNNQPGVEKVFHHYTLVGNKNAGRDDIILVESGGPGFPSSGFMFLEGASGFQLNAFSYLTEEFQKTGIPSPIDRDFAWTELGVLIGLDNPPPTGYSYCLPAGPSGDGSSCGIWNDTTVGIAQAEAFNVIMTDHFPQLLPAKTTRKIFSFAESYGGVYAAALAEQVFKRPEYAHFASRFAGQANGDACMGSNFICGNAMESKPFWLLSFMYGHAQLSDELWQNLIAACGETTLKTVDPENYNGECAEAYSIATTAIGHAYYAYNLYSTCAGNLFGSSEDEKLVLTGNGKYSKNNNRLVKTHHRKGPVRHNHAALASLKKNKNSNENTFPAGINEAENFNGYICMTDAFPTFMTSQEVMQAFGVALDSNFFIADDAVGLPYNFTLVDGFKIWRDVINAGLNISASLSSGILPRPADSPVVRVYAYQGDADPAVLITWTQRVWRDFFLNFTKFSTKDFGKTREWSDYFLASPRTESSNPYSKVQAGKTVEWGMVAGPSNKTGLVGYMTVSGSGHMVPEYKSMNALAMARKFMYDDQ